MDKLVIDIETKNTFQDVGGYKNLTQLKMSFVGVYSYNKDEYLSFFENEFDKLGPVLQSASLIITFSGNRFDIPILNEYYPFNVKAIESLDILDDIEEKLGHRVKLDVLAHTNLGVGKSGSGLDAIRYYDEGKFEELKKYCLQDVKVTKDLYELGLKQGYLMVPTDHGRSVAKVEFNWKHRLPSIGTQTLF
ncbi:MAG: ribonuclease H-like domain-containing protein [Patescibacteria group bacterium]|nr:ribonuclease H-like domain-containing protein [Patescibacteria group bacterium]